MPKVKRIPDEEHLEYVRRQSCCECSRVALSLDPEMTRQRRRLSDPHHLRNTQHPRRFFDWFTVPLCRVHHNRIDTAAGQKWERENWPRLMRVAATRLFRNGRISADRLEDLLTRGDDTEAVKEWVDSLIQDGQNWDGGIIV